MWPPNRGRRAACPRSCGAGSGSPLGSTRRRACLLPPLGSYFLSEGMACDGAGCGSGRLRADVGLVALGLELVGEFGAAFLGDPAVDEDVHEVGLDVPQDTGVVRDEQEAAVGGLLGVV